MPGITRVGEAQADQVTELFALAFRDDPTWGWAFPDLRGAWTNSDCGGASPCTPQFRMDLCG